MKFPSRPLVTALHLILMEQTSVPNAPLKPELLCHTTFIILLSGCDPLQFFFWEFSAMSQQQSRDLETLNFSQDTGSTQDG